MIDDRLVTHLRIFLITTLILAGSFFFRFGVHAQGGNTQSPPSSALASSADLPAGFQDSVVFSDLEAPTIVEFSPDGRVFVGEKSGLIKVFDSLADTTPDVFADLRTNVHNFWDRGLLGLTLHPNFPTTPYVYVLYTHDAPIGGTAPEWGQPGETSDTCPTLAQGCVVSGRLSRLQASGNQMVGAEQVLIEDWFQQFQAHSVAGLVFGPDGALYVTGGDGANFNYVDWGQDGNPAGDPPGAPGMSLSPPTAEGGALRSQDLRTRTDPLGLSGSLIRVDPNTGLGLPDNPLAGDSEENAQRMIAHGFRMPFRLAIRPGTNEIWVADTGWDSIEEINRVVPPTGTTVQNFGWPCYEGPSPQGAYDATNLNLCEQLYTTPGAVTPPYYHFNHSDPVIAGDGCGQGSGSITGIAFHEGTRFPARYAGALFFADYERDCIWVMYAGPDGLPDPATRENFRLGANTPVDLKFHDGELFYIDIGGGTVRRIRPFNPTAVAQASPLFGPLPLQVTFDGSASTDPEGEPLTYAWEFDGDGDFNDATTPQATFTFTTSGVFSPALRVTDPNGLSDVQTVTIRPGELGPPTPVIDAPAGSLSWSVGQTIQFSGHATDPGIGALPASALSWSLIINHCPAGCHTHTVQSFEGVAAGSFVAPDHEYPSHLVLQLTATDSSGLQGTTSVELQPASVQLSFDSAPSGIPLTVLTASRQTPFTTSLLRGGSVSISAPPAYIVGNQFYRFQAWSDGGAATHNIGPVLGSQAYTATYAPGSDVTSQGTPIALITTPLGGGSPSLDVIRDGVFPTSASTSPTDQYDTFTGDTMRTFDWIGYEFPTPRRFVGLTFQEGREFHDGGWFNTLTVEVRSGGTWTAVPGLVSSPTYPGANGVPYDKYALSFAPIVGDAIRIAGTPGGPIPFISVGELRAIVDELSISPPTGVYTSTQSFDLALSLNLLGRTIAGGSITFDGVNVTGVVVSCIVPGAGASGLVTLRCPNLGGPVIGPGTHVLDVTLVLSDGSQLRESVTWTVLPTGNNAVANPSFSISPPTGTYTSTQRFDLVLAFELAGRGITGGSVTFNGVDVTSAIASCVVDGAGAPGLLTLRCPDLGGPVVGPGTHVLDVSVVLNDGSQMRRSVMWTVVPVVEQ